MQGTQQQAADRGIIGTQSYVAKFDDEVKLTVELSAPAYAYLLAFNVDGKEQLLWPVDASLKSNEDVPPPLTERFHYPAKAGHAYPLNDDADGGWQAFAVVASSKPLPPHAEWKKARIPAVWQKLPPGNGVWSSDGEGIYAVNGGQIDRSKDRPMAAMPPLLELCQSLQKETRNVVVEVLAFPVRPKE